jgi:hypothetical protein
MDTRRSPVSGKISADHQQLFIFLHYSWAPTNNLRWYDDRIFSFIVILLDLLSNLDVSHPATRDTIAVGPTTRTSWQITGSFNADHHLLLVYMSLLVNPLAATSLFSPSSLARAALFGLVVFMPRGRTVAPAPDSPKGPVRQCTIGTSPLSIRWWILEVVHSIFSYHRVSPDLSAMASPTLAMDPSDVARR